MEREGGWEGERVGGWEEGRVSVETQRHAIETRWDGEGGIPLSGGRPRAAALQDATQTRTCPGASWRCGSTGCRSMPAQGIFVGCTWDRSRQMIQVILKYHEIAIPPGLIVGRYVVIFLTDCDAYKRLKAK